MPPSPVRHVLSTGQRLCFDERGCVVDCPGSGQDGEFLSGIPWPVPRFEILGENLALDRLTGLTWPRMATVGDFAMPWAEALAAVARMNEENAFGHIDWRLPNRRELASLISHAHHRPALPADHPFTVRQAWYWTSTTASIAPAYAWHVHMEGGRMFFGDKARDAMVWPVRGESRLLPRAGQTVCRDVSGMEIACAGTGQDGELLRGAAWPAPRFTMEDGCVRDLLTNLLWMRAMDWRGLCSWEEALEAARLCRADGRNWRLPNIRELESVVDADRHDPALSASHPFTDTREAYWSSTTSGFAPDWAYCLYLHKGAVGVGFKATREFHAWFVAQE